MAYVTTTTTVIGDDFFAEQVTPVSSDTAIATEPQDVNVSNADLPADHPDRITLNNNLQNGKVPANQTIRTIVTRKTRFVRPVDDQGADVPIAPDALEPPYCEIYKFSRIHTTETRRYLVFGITDLLFSVDRREIAYNAWVRICSGAAPILLREALAAEIFPPQPPPLPSGPETWFWLPPEVVEFQPGPNDPQGHHHFPDFDDKYFYHVRMVKKLELPVVIDNAACLIRATYAYYWRVTRVDRITGNAVSGSDNPSYHRVPNSGGTVDPIPIPNCPRLPKHALKLADPTPYCRDVMSGIATRARLGPQNAAGEFTDVALLPAQPDGLMRFKSGSALAWIPTGSEVPAVLRIASTPVPSLFEVSPEWTTYLTMHKPDEVYMQLWGTVTRGADGYLHFTAQTARLEGMV